jgi:predicted nuclease of restriction endonuclease-like (RecB) superfamily
MAKKKMPSTEAVISASLLESYHQVLKDIINKVKSAQARALIAVNRELVELYKEIGKTIFEQQQEAKWGDAIVERLAKDLQMKFPGMKGFSSRNLWNMKDFYSSYRESEKLQKASAEISWSHNVAILSKCHDSFEREFYMRMSKRNGWSYPVLLNQIDNKNYEKTMLAQTNFDQNLPDKIKSEANMAVKDEYAFGFLELGEEHSEYELEKAIVGNIEKFLREVGGAYAFLGSQYRLEVGDQEYFIDLLLYNRKLKALVAIELKISTFIPEYIGKMQFYLSILNDTMRLEGESPAIGIILCKEKNRTVVKYALKDSNQPIGIAAYRTTPNLPKELQGELPTPDQIEKLLEYLR